MAARTSAVQHSTGAWRLMLASPVSMPTWAAPSWAHSSKNFSVTRALMGEVYTERRPRAKDRKCKASATNDFPEPVGVLRITWRPAKTSRMACSWAG
jgi:hypothetical protein